MLLFTKAMARAPPLLVTLGMLAFAAPRVKADSCTAFGTDGFCYELGGAIESATGELDALVKSAGADGFESIFDNFLAPMVNFMIAADDPTGFCFGDYTGDEVDDELEDYGCDFLPLDSDTKFGLLSGSLPITTELQMAFLALGLWTNVQPETVTPQFCMAMRVPSTSCHKMTFALTVNDGTITALCEVIPAGGVGDAILSLLAAIVELGLEQVGFGMSMGGGLDVPVKYYANKQFQSSTFPAHLYFNVKGSIELPFLPEKYKDIISCEGEFARAFNFGDTIEAVSTVVENLFDPDKLVRTKPKEVWEIVQALLLFPEVVTTEARLTIALEDMTEGLLQDLELADASIMAMKVPLKKLGDIPAGFYLSLETNIDILDSFAKQLCDQIDGALKAVSGGGCPKLPNLSISGKIGMQITADRIEAFIQVPGFLVECQVWNLNPFKGKRPKMSCQVDNVIFEILEEAVGYVIGKAEELGKEIAEEVTQVSKSAVKAAKGFGKDVSAFAKLSSKAADHYIDEIDDLFDDVGKDVLDAAKRALDEANEFFNDVDKKAKEAVKALNSAKNVLDKAAQDVLDESARLAEKAAKEAEKALKKGADHVKKTANKVGNAAEKGVNTVGNAIKKIKVKKLKFWRRLGAEDSALDFEDEDEDHEYFLDEDADDASAIATNRSWELDDIDGVYLFEHVFDEDEIDELGLTEHVLANDGILTHDAEAFARLRELRELKTDLQKKEDAAKRRERQAKRDNEIAQAALNNAAAKVKAAEAKANKANKYKSVGMGFFQHYKCKGGATLWDSAKKQNYKKYFSEKGNDDSRRSCFESCYEFVLDHKESRRNLCCEYQANGRTNACRVSGSGREEATSATKSATLTVIKDFESIAGAKSIGSNCKSGKECYTGFCDNGRCKVKCAADNRCFPGLYSKCFKSDGNCLDVGGVNHFCDKATDSCMCDDSTGKCERPERTESRVDLFPFQSKENVDVEKIEMKPIKMLPNKKGGKKGGKKGNNYDEDGGSGPMLPPGGGGVIDADGGYGGGYDQDGGYGGDYNGGDYYGPQLPPPPPPPSGGGYSYLPPPPPPPPPGGDYSYGPPPPPGRGGQVIVQAPEVVIRASRIVVEPDAGYGGPGGPLPPGQVQVGGGSFGGPGGGGPGGKRGGLGGPGQKRGKNRGWPVRAGGARGFKGGPNGGGFEGGPSDEEEEYGGGEGYEMEGGAQEEGSEFDAILNGIGDFDNAMELVNKAGMLGINPTDLTKKLGVKPEELVKQAKGLGVKPGDLIKQAGRLKMKPEDLVKKSKKFGVKPGDFFKKAGKIKGAEGLVKKLGIGAKPDEILKQVSKGIDPDELAEKLKNPNPEKIVEKLKGNKFLGKLKGKGAGKDIMDKIKNVKPGGAKFIGGVLKGKDGQDIVKQIKGIGSGGGIFGGFGGFGGNSGSGDEKPKVQGKPRPMPGGGRIPNPGGQLTKDIKIPGIQGGPSKPRPGGGKIPGGQLTKDIKIPGIQGGPSKPRPGGGKKPGGKLTKDIKIPKIQGRPSSRPIKIPKVIKKTGKKPAKKKPAKKPARKKSSRKRTRKPTRKNPTRKKPTRKKTTRRRKRKRKPKV